MRSALAWGQIVGNIGWFDTIAGSISEDGLVIGVGSTYAGRAARPGRNVSTHRSELEVKSKGEYELVKRMQTVAESMANTKILTRIPALRLWPGGIAALLEARSHDLKELNNQNGTEKLGIGVGTLMQQ